MLLPNGKLNVDLLRKEIASDVSLHDRYRAEDAMKKRAIHSSQNYDEFRNLVLASQLKPVNQAEMSQLFSGGGGGGGGGGDASTVGSIKSRVGNSGAMNKAFNIGHRGDSGDIGGGVGSGVGGIFGSHDPSMAAAERGRAVLAALSSQSSPSVTAKAGGGGSLFDQSNPAELEGLNWKQLQKKMTKKQGRKSSKKTNKGKKSSGEASSPFKINPLQFEREWRRSCTDAASTAQYLLRTESVGDGDYMYSMQPCSSVGSKRRLVLRPEEASRTVFKVELGSDIMGDILSALAYLCGSSSSSSSSKDDLVTDEVDGNGNHNDDVISSSSSPSFVYRWMISITRCGRFGLNVSFLTEAQKQDVEYVLASLEQHIDGKGDETDECCGGGSSSFTEEDIMRVRELYK